MRKSLIIIALALTACQAPSIVIGNAPVPAPAPLAAGAINKADPPMSKPGGTYRQYLEARMQCIGGKYFTCMALAGWQYDPKGFPPPSRPVAMIDRYPDPELPPDL